MVKDIIVMAAGKGSRLTPLTDDKPKCMVEINGKPIIRYIYDNINKAIDEPYIIIVCGYKKEVLIDYFTKNKLSCQFVEQKEINGTGGAIESVKEYITDSFIVLSGDIIYEPDDICRLLEKESSLLYTKQKDKLYEYGTLDIYDDDIQFINEKSTKPTSNLVNCGAYHFTIDVFDYIEQTQVDERFNERIITNTINMMISDYYLFKGIYIDCLNEITRVEDIRKYETNSTRVE